MSQRTLHQKKSHCSLKSVGLKPERVISPYKQDDSSDDSDDNLPYHRPRCPWGRRLSYVQKVKKTFLDNSVSCLNGVNQSTINRKPWLGAGVSTKDNETWKRPWGNKISGVNCFCARIEQAKVATPSKKNYQADLIESRRNHIVNKFDGFSKGILKITGKLSQVTIEMITAKIKENLEKNSDITLDNVYGSSFKLAKNSPYSRLNDSSRALSSKFAPGNSCVQVALMPSEFNMLGYKNNKMAEASKPTMNIYKKRFKKIRTSEPSYLKLRSTVGREKSIFGEKLTSVPEVDSESDKDNSSISKGNKSACSNISSNEKVVIRVKVENSDKRQRGDSPKVKIIQSCDNNTLNKDKEKSAPIIQKVVNFCDQPVSEDNSFSSDNNNSSAETTTSLNNICSMSSKASHIRERSVSFDDNIQYSDERSLLANENSSYSEGRIEQSPKSYQDTCSTVYQTSVKNDISSMAFDTLKSNINYVKMQEPLDDTKKQLSDLNKNILQIAAKRKLLRDWDVKKLIQPSTECTGNGYSVQLVKLKNYDRKQKKPSPRK